MIPRRLARAALLLLALTAAGFGKPNLVLILTDNHGAWTLGCYGNRDIRTPNIDRLAAEGVLFENAFANNAVCSPTRASLLTGLMPSQHGVHRYLAAGGLQIGPDAYNTLAEFDTLPSLLVEQGYVAGLSGKWHLGDNLHPQEGFTSWVTMPHGASTGFYDKEVIEDGKIRNEPQYLTDLWTDHGVRFIEENRERPFFLMLSYNGPYGLGQSMREPIRNRHREYYAEHPMPSMPRDAPHPWNFNHADWLDDLAVRRKYAAGISGIDDGVGRIVETLERLKLTENTLVVFIGDQGLAGGHSGFWGMGDHTRPLTAFDWTMQIPLILRQPGKIPAGRRIERVVANYDLLPTLVPYFGLRSPEHLPGRSLSELIESPDAEWDDVMFFEFENVRAIRTAEWKYVERYGQSPNELYHLTDDRGERLNRMDDPALGSVQQDLRRRLHEFFDKYADPQWDLWRGGGSKTGLITEQIFGKAAPRQRPR